MLIKTADSPLHLQIVNILRFQEFNIFIQYLWSKYEYENYSHYFSGPRIDLINPSIPESYHVENLKPSDLDGNRTFLIDPSQYPLENDALDAALSGVSMKFTSVQPLFGLRTCANLCTILYMLILCTILFVAICAPRLLKIL